MTRRIILLGSSASLVAMACGGDDGDGTGGGGTTATGGEGGVANTGGSDAGGTGPGGSNVGGAAATCGLALLAKGSNYGTDPHDLAIPIADIEAGVTKTYTTTGTSHTHDVTVTEADFAALRNGDVVTIYACFSNPGATDHEFILDCANPENTSLLDGEIGDETACG